MSDSVTPAVSLYSETMIRHKKVMLVLTDIAQEVLISGKEMPIITLLTFQNKIISINYNKTNENKNGIHHGEYLSFKNLPIDFLEKHIEDVTLYVNVEPCIMCESMIQQMGLKKVVFSCENERFGASLLPKNALQPDRLQIIPYILRKEAIVTLRQFYLQENKNAPKLRRKEGRLLDLETFPGLKWSNYFASFDLFYTEFFSDTPSNLKTAQLIYNENLDLEEMNMDLLKLRTEEFGLTSITPVLNSVEEQVKEFWDLWREPKKRKNE